MARPTQRERLTSIADAATRVFGRSGYRGTRTADVARTAGVSTGSLFTYVASKEALFHLVFLHAFGDLADTLPPLPISSAGLDETLRLIEARLRNVATPRLRSALEIEEPSDVRRELAEIVGERYDTVDRYWPVIAVIERCAVDIPELESFYFRRARAGYFEFLTRYLDRRSSSGLLRTMPDVGVAARVITETVSWFAWKRREGRDADVYDDELVKQTIIEFACAALCPGPDP